jgi:hypothetical protein
VVRKLTGHIPTMAIMTIVLSLLTGCGRVGPHGATPVPVTGAASPPGRAQEPVAVPSRSATARDLVSDPQAAVPSPLRGAGDAGRRILTYEALMQGIGPPSPVDESALAMPAGAADPAHTFEGRLALIGEATEGSFSIIKGDLDPASEAPHLPEFDYAFVQSGSYLIPVERGLIITDHPNWNLILEPGRVWQEAGDGDYSRASFPFGLVWKGSNATFNGTMTFLFDRTTVSHVWYQITQETCWSLKADFWGLLEADYLYGPVAGVEQVRSDHARELAGRFPTKPIEQLALDYPGTDITSFGRGVTPEHMTIYGFVINGVNYVGGCPTRYGEYAYCEAMRVPSYSIAKSAFVSVALMRLAQKYDPEIPRFLIQDYVPEHVGSPGDWGNVTFDHTLDMATGNYSSPQPMVDEEDFATDPFWSEEFYAGRIAAAFAWPHSAAPGTRWVYHTSDTFIVTRALHNYLQTREGPDADIFQFVVDEVFVPIGIGPGAHTTLRTRDNNWQGQAYGGYGLWWIQDDIAKIATLLNNDGGAAHGDQILHPDLLADAMQDDPNDRGVDISSRFKYNNAFWATEFTPGDGYDCSFWVPHMVGYTGDVVAMMPNGSTYYYFSDNREFDWSAAVRESNHILPHCQ